MNAIRDFLVRKFQTFKSIPQYFEAAAKEWMNILFGETVVGVIFLVWWALGTPPLTLIFLSAALVAGYYAWRPNYLLRIPRVQIRRFVVTETPTTSPGVLLAYIHIIPECMSEAPVYECQGHLLRILRYAPINNWMATEINEPVELVWSIYDDTVPRTLQPGVETRLNLCWISSIDRSLHLASERIPLRFSKVLNAKDSFRFDIRLTAKDCPPADLSIKVQVGESWNKPIVELISSNP